MDKNRQEESPLLAKPEEASQLVPLGAEVRTFTHFRH